MAAGVTPTIVKLGVVPADELAIGARRLGSLGIESGVVEAAQSWAFGPHGGRNGCHGQQEAGPEIAVEAAEKGQCTGNVDGLFNVEVNAVDVVEADGVAERAVVGFVLRMF